MIGRGGGGLMGTQDTHTQPYSTGCRRMIGKGGGGVMG